MALGLEQVTESTTASVLAYAKAPGLLDTKTENMMALVLAYESASVSGAQLVWVWGCMTASVSAQRLASPWVWLSASQSLDSTSGCV